MCVFRALVGFLASASVFIHLLDWQRWYSEDGYVPLAMQKAWSGPLPSGFTLFGKRFAEGGTFPRIDLLGSVVDPRLSLAFLIAILVAALLTTVGLFTRVSSALLALGIVCLNHRNGIILQGGDTALRCCVLYVALMPGGAMYSIDAWRRAAKGDLSVALASVWPQRLVAWNCALVYLTTVWLKLENEVGNPWRDGSATWYPARLIEMARFPVPPFMNEFPMVRITTYGTLIVEVALGTIAFYRPCRKWALLGGVLLHLYIELTMNVPIFPYVMVAMYVSYYSGEEVEGWVSRMRARFGRKPIAHETLAI